MGHVCADDEQLPKEISDFVNSDFFAKNYLSSERTNFGPDCPDSIFDLDCTEKYMDAFVKEDMKGHSS